MRYTIKLSYNGAFFHGWQVQPNENSVQECLENALSTLLRSKIAVTGAGRTDTGVNAIAYVAHFDSNPIENAGFLCYKLNAILPKAIVIHSICEASEDFHARFDASRREYTYYIHRVKDPFVDHYSFLCQYPNLDFDLMNKAAAMLVGRHDFSCFEKSGTDCKTSICTVASAQWSPYSPCPASWEAVAEDGVARYWKFEIAADRFLRNMVRAVVGTLLEVGRGKRSFESFKELILPVEESSQKVTRRSLAGESVAGHALFLTKVEY